MKPEDKKQELTQEQKRIKIAEACGHSTDCVCPTHGAVARERIGDAMECPWCGQYCNNETPDYFNDLNAMNEAETHIGTLRSKRHGQLLQEITGWHCIGIVPNYERDLIYLSRLSRATAAQRAEAFGQTLGLWEAGQ